MTETIKRRKKFTVGLWMEPTFGGGKPSGLQIWNIQPGEIKEPKLIWHTVVLAHNDDEALQLGQEEYAGKHISKPEAEAA